MRLQRSVPLLVLLVAACTAGGAPTPVPSGDPSATASASADPTATILPSGQSTSPLSLGSPTPISGELVVQLVVFYDVYRAPVPPELSLYADGRVVTPAFPSTNLEGVLHVVRRLTSNGLAAAVAAFDGAVTTSGEIGAPTASGGWEGGYNTYVVSVRRAGRLVTARTTNASADPAARALVAFAESWIDAAAAGPAAWLDPVPVPFVPTHWSISTWPGGSAEETQFDAALLVPLLGDLASFGTAQGGDPTHRCGIVDRATLEALLLRLQEAGVTVASVLDGFDVTVRAPSGAVGLTVTPVLPEVVTACPPASP